MAIRIRSRCDKRILLGLVLSLSSTAAFGAGRKATLARKYRRGQTLVYRTELHSEATVHTEPPGLAAFLPPFPTELTTRQENTITVRAVHADGGADVENRFNRFELESNLSARSPEEMRQSTEQSQREFGRRIAGRTLIAHYDGHGHLTGVDGADSMLQSLDALLRKPLEEALQVFLEQMGGGLEPGRRVTLDEQWSHKFSSQATPGDPWNLEGESTWHYSGETRYGKTRAAMIDFRFSDVLTPALDRLAQANPPGPLAQLGTLSSGLNIVVRGQGQGRLLVALDDGRLLENHTETQQTLTASLKGAPAPPGGAGSSATGSTTASPTASDPLKVEISSRTTLQMDAFPKSHR
ncbi:MAG TPA: hypothetical protein VG204_11075 [Terriglobia bacterium]|nr:hypothetical protein [Terriglobia bacterium]